MRHTAVILAAVLAVSAPASATAPTGSSPVRTEETTATLRQPAIDWCVRSMTEDSPARGAVATCTCMIDAVITDFGPDAKNMLRILIAGLDPSDVEEIAKILEASRADAQTFIDAANIKLATIQKTCMA